jgi:prophage endopeptidase
MNRLLVALVAALAWSGAVFYAGYAAGDAQRNTAWLKVQADYEHDAKQALQAAQARGDALTTGLLNQQSQIDQLKTEKQHAIKVATTGRACLGADALRVLDKSPGITVSGPAQAASSPAAAGEPIATDTDIALWIVNAGASFEVCRARLDALIDWNLGN